MADIKTVTSIAKCLNLPIGEVTFNEEKLVTRISPNSNETLSGFANILSALARESSSEIARNSVKTREIEAQVYQWIEYAALYVAPGCTDKHIATQLLRDFNKLFLNRSYLVGYSLTIADLAVFFTIYELMKSLSPLDKENYLNLSRWFNHLQQRTEVRQGSELLNFATIYLHNWATGTHK